MKVKSYFFVFIQIKGLTNVLTIDLQHDDGIYLQIRVFMPLLLQLRAEKILHIFPPLNPLLIFLPRHPAGLNQHRAVLTQRLHLPLQAGVVLPYAADGGEGGPHVPEHFYKLGVQGGVLVLELGACFTYAHTALTLQK